MTMTITRDETKRIISAIEGMAKARLFVGIPGEKSGRKDGAIGNASLGYIHENGSPARNIPARPFLVPGVREISGKIADVLKSYAAKAVTGGATIDQGLNAAGLIAQAAVKRRIISQEGFTPLMDSTIKARKRAGKSGTKALIRIGQLLNSITYVIKRK